MIEVRQTRRFAAWFAGLRDQAAKARIAIRIRRVTLGNLGDAKFFEGIGELRIDYGPGYRVYFVRLGEKVVILLCGGDKRRQAQDVKLAKRLAEEIDNGG